MLRLQSLTPSERSVRQSGVVPAITGSIDLRLYDPCRGRSRPDTELGCCSVVFSVINFILNTEFG